MSFNIVIEVIGGGIASVISLYVLYRIWNFLSGGNTNWKFGLLVLSGFSVASFVWFLMTKFFDFVSIDQSWVSPVIFFVLLTGIVSVIAIRFFEVPPVPNLTLFVLYSLTNIFNLYFASVIVSQGVWVMHLVAVAITLPITIVILVTIKMAAIKTKMTMPSVVYTVFAFLSAAIAAKVGYDISKNFGLTANFPYWWFFVVSSGALVGRYIMYPIQKILHLP